MAVPVKFVDPWRIQRFFNRGGYWQMVKAGELVESVVRQHHPSPPLSFVPFCTRSQLVAYHDIRGVKVAMVHQYLQPDGTLGASGRPDPKYLLHQGTLYKAKEKRA